MKLILCPECNDIFNLSINTKKCSCGKCYGRYKDNVNAFVSTDSIVIGFHNGSLIEALTKTPLPERGTDFKAFIISKKAKSITIVD